jgi:hypothetical protein
VTGKGTDISVAVSVWVEKIACSVEEYAKHAVSWFRNDIVLAECGKAVSYSMSIAILYV